MLLRDTVYQAIRLAILNCELLPGQELREQVLAERYRVSRSPIRDSLLRLEKENLVTVQPRQGYRVKPIATSDVEDVFGLRLLVEPACAVAAVHADDSALRALDRFRGFADRDSGTSGYAEYNEAVHHAIAALSGNTRMTAVAWDLVEQSDRFVRVALRGFELEFVRHLCSEHEAIIDALQARDADRASRLSFDHTEGAHDRVATALRFIARE
jgi:GntR family transcriptional regulator, rspAB operon transcriptional repressor